MRNFVVFYFIGVITQKPMMIKRIGKSSGGDICQKTSDGDFKCHKNEIPKSVLAITLAKQPSMLINLKGNIKLG